MLMKDELPRLTKIPMAKLDKSNLEPNSPTKIETTDGKMILLPMDQYLDMVRVKSQMAELKQRLALLEDIVENAEV